jgi:hypothetical protein
LDTSKLKEQYPQVKNAKEAMIEAMQEVKKSLENGGPKAPPKPE